MKHKSKGFIRHLDGVLFLLLFFVFLLFLLFVYLEHIDKRSKDYYIYKKDVEILHQHNQELDNIFIRSYRYLDNDSITNRGKAFSLELKKLDKNELTSIFGEEVQHFLMDIATRFDQKMELIERFKTLNARITSSVYYLYELKQQIKHNGIIEPDIQHFLSDTLFSIGQVFLDTNLGSLGLEKTVEEIGKYRDRDEDLNYFYMHAKQFLSDVSLMQKILIKHKAVHLDESIDALDNFLERKYLYNKDREEHIALVFFGFAFVVLLILIRTYLNVLKNKRKVDYLAYHDTLTNLPNRADFERYVDMLISGTNKRLKQFSVLFIDLDRFKGINDTLGHDAGDEILIVLSKRICEVIGEKNFLARIGGDEFVAIIQRKKDIQRIRRLVSEIISIIRSPIEIHEYHFNVTASIGIANFPQDGTDRHTLLKHADSAMYEAKSKGRDTYAYYTSELSVAIQRRLDIEQALVHALHNDEFYLCFQPQYELSTGRTVGVEALIRWKNTLLGTVSPEEFIAVAEDTGVIVELGYYIFKEACVTYVDWVSKGINIDLMAINISSVQLRQVNAFENFKKIIEDTGIDPKHIEIELTERYLMEYSTGKLTILDDFRALGCHISIDDFGTGYSSLGYLKSLDIDTIKIDKSFIQELSENEKDAYVVKAVILLAQSLGYKVVAEGIESLEQENLLRKYLCDVGQGYYYAKPMSSEELVSFYHNHKDIVTIVS